MPYYVGILDGSAETFGVLIPDLRGAYGAGDTADQAIESAIHGAAEIAAHLKVDGYAIPVPRTVEEVLNDPKTEMAKGDSIVMIPLLLESGRTVRANLTMDAGLLDAIDLAARKRGVTRSAYMASAAREKILASA